MGFNLGAFAGGLAQGIQKGTELKQRQQQLEQDAINKSIEQNNKLAKQYADNKKVVSDNLGKVNEVVKDYEKQLTDAMTEKTYDSTTRREKINEIKKNYRQALDSATNGVYGSEVTNLNQDDLNSVNAQISTIYSNTDTRAYTPITINGKDVNVAEDVARAYTDNPDGYRLDNGTIVDKTTNQVIGKSKTFDIPKDYKSSDFFDVNIGGKKTPMLISKWMELDKQGLAPSKWVQDASPKVSVNVMGEGKPIDRASVFGTFYANKDTGEPLKDKDGNLVYKNINAEGMKLVNKINTYNSISNGLDTMIKVFNKNPDAVGSFGEDPIKFAMNYANDYLGIPTENLPERNTVKGLSGMMTTMVRNMNETGVATDKDIERYMPLIPSPNDATDVAMKKTKTLMNILKYDLKTTKNALGSTSPVNINKLVDSAKMDEVNKEATAKLAKEAPYGDTVVKGGKTYKWNAAVGKYQLDGGK